MIDSIDLANSVPPMRDNDYRIEMTVGCRDCDDVPKVPNAGKIVVEDGIRVQIMHNGIRVLADGYYGAWMTEVIRRLRGHHEPQEELIFDALLRLLPDNATMIELGGFWCYYTLWFLSQGGQRRAFVIEPDPNYITIGRQNAAINGTEVTFVQGFVGRESLQNITFLTESAGSIRLPMINVAEFIEQYAIEQVDVLHCDIQGGELDVVATCADLCRSHRIRFMVMSTHAEMIAGDPLVHQRCLQEIENIGGRVLAEHDVHESFSGDGLIVAYFGGDPLHWPRLKMSYNRYSTSLFRNPLYDLALSREEGANIKCLSPQPSITKPDI